jgi:hypothetical protein
MYYLWPEREKEVKIYTGTTGMIIDDRGQFVWVVTCDGAFQAQKKHLGVIGKSTPKRFYGYDTVAWNKIVGDGNGIWMEKEMMYLGGRGEL